jgi:hypothetical protein
MMRIGNVNRKIVSPQRAGRERRLSGGETSSFSLERLRDNRAAGTQTVHEQSASDAIVPRTRISDKLVFGG